ncbi:MAG: 30S ribosome-binding factor RbfA [Patescibacteria group bacterium]
MSTFRIQQLNKLILQLLNEHILRDINMPDGCFVTITKVDTTRDLSLARVTISVIPTGRQDSILAYMNRQAGYSQHAIGGKLKVYKVPKLMFYLDTGGSHVERVDELIDKIHNEK